MVYSPTLNNIVAYLLEKYGCHTIILYGSYARGVESSTSDFDIVAIRDRGPYERDCSLLDGHHLDAFIYNEEQIAQHEPFMMRILEGVVLCQKESVGNELITKAKDMYERGPASIPDWERHEISSWLHKMLERAKSDDIEGHFRLHWLLHDSLECYFKLRGQWYLGPKESFAWLKLHDVGSYAAFSDALKLTSDHETIARLIDHILSAL